MLGVAPVSGLPLSGQPAPPAAAPPSPPPPAPAPAAPAADVIDDDTERAVLALWLASTQDLGAGADVVDQDTEAAVVVLWSSTVQLSGFSPQPPRTGRLKAGSPGVDPQASPYVTIESKLEKRDLMGTGGGYSDYRRVTIKVYGVRADVVKGMALIKAVFKRGAQLSYPSGARFLQWWADREDTLEEDPSTKAGRDVWVGTVSARVWSIRQV